MQQHLVAHDDRLDRIGIVLGQRDRGLDQLRVFQATIADPDAEKNLQSDLGCKFGHLFQSVVDGIGADAVRHLGKLGQIFLDLLRADDQFRVQWSLGAPKRRIGYALQFR